MSIPIVLPRHFRYGEPRTAFARQLRVQMKQNGIATMLKLANQIGVEYNRLNGQALFGRPPPSRDELRRLAQFLVMRPSEVTDLVVRSEVEAKTQLSAQRALQEARLAEMKAERDAEIAEEEQRDVESQAEASLAHMIGAQRSNIIPGPGFNPHSSSYG